MLLTNACRGSGHMHNNRLHTQREVARPFSPLQHNDPPPHPSIHYPIPRPTTNLKVNRLDDADPTTCHVPKPDMETAELGPDDIKQPERNLRERWWANTYGEERV
jgi:hypothetical protein